MHLNKFNFNKGLIVLGIGFIGLIYNPALVAAEGSDIIIVQDIDKNNQKTENINDQPQSQLEGRAIMIDLNSDKLEFFQEKNQFVATGNAEIVIPEQNSKLEADTITYDQTQQVLIAEGSVKITKEDKVIYGNYAKVELEKESALINEPNTVVNKVKITANSANIYPKHLEALKGKANIDNEDLKLMLSTDNYSIDQLDELQEQNKDKTGIDTVKYRITSKEIIVDNRDNINVIKVKNATVYAGKVKLAHIPYLEFSTDKEISRVETGLPEVGSGKELGLYFGPGHVFYLPNGATFKAAPIVSFGDGIGGGGLVRYMSKSNRTEVGFVSNKNKIAIRGEQNLFSPKTKLLYATNTYVEDGIWGKRRPKQLVEIADERKLLSAFNFNLFTRLSAGYAQDYLTAKYLDDNPTFKYNQLNSVDGGFGTARVRLQGKLINDKPIFQYHDDLLRVRLQSQFGFSAYGTGDTFGVLMAGPKIDSRIGPLKLSSSYYQAGMFGRTPFVFDRYVYGKSNLTVSGDLRINKYVNIGHIRSLNLTKDNWEKRFSTENEIYAKLGPEDFKFKLGYDFVRQRSVFGVDLLLGSGKTEVDFDKLRVNDLKKTN